MFNHNSTFKKKYLLSVDDRKKKKCMYTYLNLICFLFFRQQKSNDWLVKSILEI